MLTFTTIVHVFVSILLICAILLQSGRGGGLAGLGGAAAGQVFGGRGAGNFLTKLTSTAAIVFFLTSMVLSFGTSSKTSVITQVKGTEAPAAAEEAPVAAEEAPVAAEGISGRSTSSGRSTGSSRGTGSSRSTSSSRGTGSGRSTSSRRSSNRRSVIATRYARSKKPRSTRGFFSFYKDDSPRKSRSSRSRSDETDSTV